MAISNQTSNYTSYKYIVTNTDTGPFHTIQSCLDYVQALGETTTILVRPGTYIEDLTLYSGINITGGSEGQVIVVGEHTPPAAGTVVLTNLTLQSATSVLVSAAAGTTDITFQDCTFSTSIFAVDCANWTGPIHFDNCLEQSLSNGIVNNTGGSAIEILNSSIGAGIAPMVASGVTRIFSSRIYAPMTLSGASSLDTSYLEGALTITGTSDVTITSTKINSGAATAITTTTTGLVSIENCVIDATGLTAIDGTSSVELSSCSFADVDTIAGTIVLTMTSEFKAAKGKFRSYLEIEDGTIRANGTDPDDGMVLIGNTATNKPVWANITSTDGSLAITNGANTINLSVVGGADWQVATASMNAVAGNGYITKIAVPGLLTYTLPATAPLGSIIEITGYTVGGWAIAQLAGQSIHVAGSTTTPGVGGSLASTAQYDSVRLVCVTADTEWNVIASVGNLTIV